VFELLNRGPLERGTEMRVMGWRGSGVVGL
jgi:hypothetical protein